MIAGVLFYLLFAVLVTEVDGVTTVSWLHFTLHRFSALLSLIQVEGVYLKDEDSPKVLRMENPDNFCPLCPNKLGVRYTYEV
jgi:hypothetical protein